MPKVTRINGMKDEFIRQEVYLNSEEAQELKGEHIIYTEIGALRFKNGKTEVFKKNINFLREKGYIK
jgi:hypothetical protein